jgi:flagellar hook protein FlgE
MGRAQVVAMANDRCVMGNNCFPKATTSNLALIPHLGLSLGRLLLMLLTVLPTQAGTTNVATGVPSNVAINGSGYLVLHDPATGLLAATRDGDLMLDMDGFLVASSGMRVQGFADPSLTTIGDLQINAAGGPETNNPPASVTSYEIQTNGCLVVNLPDGSSFVRGQILLQAFQNPSVLNQIWNNMFVWSSEAGPLPQPVPPGAAGTGALLSGYLNQFVPELQLSINTGPSKSFSQGLLVGTENPTDIGIQGSGFFVLRHTNDNAQFATRAGAFYIDGAGYLVHYSGLRLQGYTDSSLTSIGDLQIDALSSPSATNPAVSVADFYISPQGVITEDLSDGSSYVRGQVLLQGCSNPDLLTRASFDLYPISTNSGLWSPITQPFTQNLGWLASGAVELSQFDTNLLSVRSNLNFFYIQGAALVTDIPANLCIFGQGFFTVRDPVANILYATRRGSFQVDAIGHLVTTNGLRLQGLNNTDLTQSGDITIDTPDAPDRSLALTNYSIDFQGHIYVNLSDGSQLLRGQILLQYYRNLQGLIPAGNGLYSDLTAGVPMFTNGLSGYIQQSMIQPGAVEQQPIMPALQLLPASGFLLLINDFGGGSVESSSDLHNWDVVSPIYSANMNVAEFYDTSQSTQKFYRVVMQSPESGGVTQPVGVSGTPSPGAVEVLHQL